MADARILKLLLQSEVCELLRCSPKTLYRLRQAGKLPFIPGRPVRIAEADVLAYIKQQQAFARLKQARRPKTKEEIAYLARLAVLKERFPPTPRNKKPKS